MIILFDFSRCFITTGLQYTAITLFVGHRSVYQRLDGVVKVAVGCEIRMWVEERGRYGREARHAWITEVSPFRELSSFPKCAWSYT